MKVVKRVRAPRRGRSARWCTPRGAVSSGGRGRTRPAARIGRALLIGVPVAFNVFFFLLGRVFDYPSVLRSPAGVVLSRFQAGGLRLKLFWYGFMLTAVLFAPLAVLLGQALTRDGLDTRRPSDHP